MEETQEYPRYFDDNDPMLGGNDGDIDEEFEDRGQAVATLTWKSQVFPLYEGDNLVGQGKEGKSVDVLLTHASVSDVHAIITINDDKYDIKDLESKNCTFAETDIGKRPLEKVKGRKRVLIKDGCVLRFGHVDCTFRVLAPTVVNFEEPTQVYEPLHLSKTSIFNDYDENTEESFTNGEEVYHQQKNLSQIHNKSSTSPTKPATAVGDALRGVGLGSDCDGTAVTGPGAELENGSSTAEEKDHVMIRSGRLGKESTSNIDVSDDFATKLEECLGPNEYVNSIYIPLATATYSTDTSAEVQLEPHAHKLTEKPLMLPRRVLTPTSECAVGRIDGQSGFAETVPDDGTEDGAEEVVDGHEDQVVGSMESLLSRALLARTPLNTTLQSSMLEARFPSLSLTFNAHDSDDDSVDLLEVPASGPIYNEYINQDSIDSCMNKRTNNRVSFAPPTLSTFDATTTPFYSRVNPSGSEAQAVEARTVTSYSSSQLPQLSTFDATPYQMKPELSTRQLTGQNKTNTERTLTPILLSVNHLSDQSVHVNNVSTVVVSSITHCSESITEPSTEKLTSCKDHNSPTTENTKSECSSTLDLVGSYSADVSAPPSDRVAPDRSLYVGPTEVYADSIVTIIPADIQFNAPLSARKGRSARLSSATPTPAPALAVETTHVATTTTKRKEKGYSETKIDYTLCNDESQRVDKTPTAYSSRKGRSATPVCDQPYRDAAAAKANIAVPVAVSRKKSRSDKKSPSDNFDLSDSKASESEVPSSAPILLLKSSVPCTAINPTASASVISVNVSKDVDQRIAMVKALTKSTVENTTVELETSQFLLASKLPTTANTTTYTEESCPHSADQPSGDFDIQPADAALMIVATKLPRSTKPLQPTSNNADIYLVSQIPETTDRAVDRDKPVETATRGERSIQKFLNNKLSAANVAQAPPLAVARKSRSVKAATKICTNNYTKVAKLRSSSFKSEDESDGLEPTTTRTSTSTSLSSINPSIDISPSAATVTVVPSGHTTANGPNSLESTAQSELVTAENLHDSSAKPTSLRTTGTSKRIREAPRKIYLETVALDDSSTSKDSLTCLAESRNSSTPSSEIVITRITSNKKVGSRAKNRVRQATANLDEKESCITTGTATDSAENSFIVAAASEARTVVFTDHAPKRVRGLKGKQMTTPSTLESLQMVSNAAKSEPKSSQINPTRIIFTGIDAEPDLVSKIGAVIVSTPQEATHMILGDSFKRTAKVMIAINYGVPFIVHLKWLEDSAKLSTPIQIPSMKSKYIVRDKDRELEWKFSLATTLGMQRGRVFENLSFYVTEGVCGVRAPSAGEMKEIVISGGGKWLTSLDSIPSHPEQLVIISTSEAVEQGVLENDRAKLKNFQLYTPDIIFLSVLRQEVNLEDSRLNIATEVTIARGACTGKRKR